MGTTPLVAMVLTVKQYSVVPRLVAPWTNRGLTVKGLRPWVVLHLRVTVQEQRRWVGQMSRWLPSQTRLLAMHEARKLSRCATPQAATGCVKIPRLVSVLRIAPPFVTHVQLGNGAKGRKQSAVEARGMHSLSSVVTVTL